MIKIACVLKSGGFNLEYVFKLLRAVERTVTQKHSFIVLSDLYMPPKGDPIRNGLENTDIDWRPLINDLPGWWSKMELFRIPGPVLYFDLDTVLTGNIDGLCNAVYSLYNNMLMLRGFKHRDVASGVMAWNSDMSWVVEQFLKIVKQATFVEIKDALRMRVGSAMFRGDQEWLSHLFRSCNTPIVFAQDVFKGIYSYKNHVRQNSVPKNAKVICFHGSPRPHELIPPPDWMKEHWS